MGWDRISGWVSGRTIPLGARIVAIADAFDATTTDRPYQKALDVPATIFDLRRGAGTQWDPDLVERFAETITPSKEAKVGPTMRLRES